MTTDHTVQVNSKLSRYGGCVTVVMVIIIVMVTGNKRSQNMMIVKMMTNHTM